MKNDLELSYKKCATKSNNVDLNRVKTLWSMYWIQFTETLQNNTLVINIDEWVISVSTITEFQYWILKSTKILIYINL